MTNQRRRENVPKYQSVITAFTYDEARALLDFIRTTKTEKDQFLVGAASRLHSAMRDERVPTGDEEWMRKQAEEVRRHPGTHEELD
jgi:hypothetical protein